MGRSHHPGKSIGAVGQSFSPLQYVATIEHPNLPCSNPTSRGYYTTTSAIKILWVRQQKKEVGKATSS